MTVHDLRQGLSDWKLTRDKAIHLLIGFSALLILEFIARPIYRPYIYRNQINDFHLADTLGNSIGVMAAIFIPIGFFRGRSRHLFLINTITISVVIFELAQPLLGKPVDPWDILATILTGMFCLVLYNVIHRNKPAN